MKILYFIDSFGAGGKERRLAEMMKSLKIHYEIEFELAIMSHEIHYKDVLNLNITIHYLVRNRKKDLSIFSKLYKLCRTIRPDILHCWDNMTAVYSVPVCKLLHIKLVNGMITNSPEKWIVFNKYWLRGKLTFPFSDYIISNSEAGMKAYGVSKKNRHVIYNGFNFDRIHNVIEKESILNQTSIETEYVVGMVANFSNTKDYITFFKAAHIILSQRNDVTFIAIGYQTDSVAASCLIKDEYKQHFRLLGKKTDIESYVNAMDVCVLATFTEGISNSILEYMAFSKPVVATNGGGTREIIEDNKTGFLVKVSDPEDLSKRINILLQNEILRRNMGIEGKKRVENVFSMKKMLDEYVSLYNRIMIDKLK